jgi:hypothetical protein
MDTISGKLPNEEHFHVPRYICLTKRWLVETPVTFLKTLSMYSDTCHFQISSQPLSDHAK